jgi:hypothetical protein
MRQMPFTEHRWHSRGSAVVNLDEGTYYARDCPGVHPPSNNALPAIRTLLSIPFSLLHTVPRLFAIVPRSRHQHELIANGGRDYISMVVGSVTCRGRASGNSRRPGQLLHGTNTPAHTHPRSSKRHI